MSLFADLKVCLRFHDNCGKLIKLSNNHQTAQVTSRGGDEGFFSLFFFQDRMVISRDPMLTDMLYQVNETFSVCLLCVSVSQSLSGVCLSVCLSLSHSVCQTCIQSCGNVEHLLHLSYKTHRRLSVAGLYWDSQIYWRTRSDNQGAGLSLSAQRRAFQDKSAGTVVLRFAGPPCQVAARATRFRRV